MLFRGKLPYANIRLIKTIEIHKWTRAQTDEYVSNSLIHFMRNEAKCLGWNIIRTNLVNKTCSRWAKPPGTDTGYSIPQFFVVVFYKHKDRVFAERPDIIWWSWTSDSWGKCTHASVYVDNNILMFICKRSHTIPIIVRFGLTRIARSEVIRCAISVHSCQNQRTRVIMLHQKCTTNC